MWGAVFTACVVFLFFFLFMQAVKTTPLETWCAFYILINVVVSSATAATNGPLSAPFTGLLIRLLPVHMYALRPVPCDVDHKQTPTQKKDSDQPNHLLKVTPTVATPYSHLVLFFLLLLTLFISLIKQGVTAIAVICFLDVTNASFSFLFWQLECLPQPPPISEWHVKHTLFSLRHSEPS